MNHTSSTKSSGNILQFYIPNTPPRISVALDDTFHIETVELSNVGATLCVAYRILRTEIPAISHQSQWTKMWKNRLAVYAVLNEASRFAYIGETEDLLKRLNDHHKKEPCKGWSVALAFCDADGKFLDKGKIKFLEHFAWDAARIAGTYKLTNSTIPTASHVPNQKDTVNFGAYMKALTLPLGVPHLFSSIVTIGSGVSSTLSSSSPKITPTSSPLQSSPSLAPSACGLSVYDYSPAVIFAASLSIIGSTLSPKEVSWLQTDAAKKDLLLGQKGLPPLKPHSGFDTDFKSSGQTRYFNPSKFVFSYNGTIYRVSKEGFRRKNGTIPTYDWAIKHGLSDAQICSECQKLGFKHR